jgi:catechol-2,3-dioxygenase
MQIKELHLEAKNVRAMRDFYHGVMKMTLLEDLEDKVAVAAGTTRLVWRKGGAHRYHLAFNIPRHRFDEGKNWIEARTPLARDSEGRETFHFANWSADAVYFFDPAGNIAELIARQTLPARRRDPFSITSVSEIGLPADDVPALRQDIHNTLGLPIYDGRMSAEFSAVGDEYGLFIIPRTGRVWLPDTGFPAEPAPVTVIVTGEEAADYQYPDYPYHIKVVPS